MMTELIDIRKKSLKLLMVALVVLIPITWGYMYIYQYRYKTQMIQSLYIMQMELSSNTAKMINEWYDNRVKDKIITQFIWLEMSRNFLNHVSLFGNKMFMIKDGRIIFDKIEDVPTTYKGKKLEDIVQIQSGLFGAKNYEEFVYMVNNKLSGSTSLYWDEDTKIYISAHHIKLGDVDLFLCVYTPDDEFFHWESYYSSLVSDWFFVFCVNILIVIFIFILRKNYKGMILYNEKLEQDVYERVNVISRQTKIIQNTYNLLKNVTNNISGLIWSIDTNGKFIFCNKYMIKFYFAYNDMDGYMDKDIHFFKDYQRKLNERYGKQLYTFLEDTSDKFDIVRKEISYIKDGYINGKYHVFQFKINPFYDTNNTLIGTVGFGYDITKIEQYKHDLIKSKSTWEKTFDSVNVMICIFDDNLKLIQMNKNAKEFFYLFKFGGDNDDINLYHILSSLFNSADVNGIINRCHSKQQIINQELSSSDYALHFELSIIPFYTDDRHNFVLLLNNISMKKHDEIKIRTSEKQFKTLFDISPIMIIMHDKTNIYHMNKEFKEFMKIDFSLDERSQRKKVRVNSILYIIKTALSEAKYKKDLKTNVHTFECQLTDPNRNKVWMEGTTTKIQYDNQEDVFITCFMNIDTAKRFTNILEDEVRLRTQELYETNLQLEQFTTRVCHDFNNYMIAIKLSSEHLYDEYADKLDEEGLRKLDNIIISYDRMKILMNGLLNLSKNTKGVLDITCINVTNVVKSLVHDILMNIEDQSKYTIIIEDDMFCNGDENMISVVFQNLIGNSIKFSNKNEHICISIGSYIDKGSEQQVYYVCDNGIGFNMENKKDPFELFKRFHKEYEGSGIGLSTVKRIIIRHSGIIWIESCCCNTDQECYERNDVRGTCVYFMVNIST
jgi:PAS domain-containing protein